MISYHVQWLKMFEDFGIARNKTTYMTYLFLVHKIKAINVCSINVFDLILDDWQS